MLVIALSILMATAMASDVIHESRRVLEADTNVGFMVVDAVSGQPTVSVGPNGQARVKIVADGARSIAGAQFDVAFDPTVIRVNASSVQPGSLGAGVFFQHKVDNTQGRLYVAFARPDAVGRETFTVVEADLTVDRAVSGCFPISIRNLIAVNGSAPPAQVAATAVGGSVCPRETEPVELSVVAADQGRAEVDVPRGGAVKMQLVANNAGRLAGIQAIIDFDQNVVNVHPGGVVVGPLLSGFVSEINVDNLNGKVLLVAANAQSLGVASVVVADIEFRALPTASRCTGVSLQDVIVGDGSIPSKRLQTDVNHARICVAESDGAPVEFKPARILASPGHDFKLDLWTNTPSTQEVTGVEIHAEFDPELLTVVNPVTRVPSKQIQSHLEDLPIVLANSVNNEAGTIVFSSGTLSKPNPVGALKFASVTFTVNSVASLDVETQVKFTFQTGETTKVSVGGSTVSGTHRDATVEIGSGLLGSVWLEGTSRPLEGFEVPVTVKFYNPGVRLDRLDAIEPLRVFETWTAPAHTPAGLRAEFFMPGVPLGRLDVTIDSEHTLMNIIRGVQITSRSKTVDLGTLIEGDADDNGVIDILDFTLLAQAFLKCEGIVRYDAATDFDRTGCVNILDFTLFSENFLKSSPILIQ
ncbi:MAG: cohesin domain-containing protein [SAR202 cluster bacterium]|jgi:hypothetical protein|nr:cohesin domain-containing protein [SAR202 cluster bacterium]